MKIREVPHNHRTFLENWVLKEAAKPFITEADHKREKHPYYAPVVNPVRGPIYQLMKEFVAEKNVERLRFWEARGIEEKGERCFRMREIFMVAQFVVLGARFRVEKPGR